MHIIHTLDDLCPYSLKASSCALGMFDGVHLGHRIVLESAIREARRLTIPSAVFTFASHPQHHLAKTPIRLLSTRTERENYFRALGFDYAVMVDFDEAMRATNASAFIQQVLVETLHVVHVSVGYDFRFGADRKGDSAYLIHQGERLGFHVQIIDPVKVGDQVVSSTVIRSLLAYGQVNEANQLLGRPYSLSGTVAQGYQRGRTLGFPTANIEPSPESYRLIPGIGTYVGIATLKEQHYLAVCNVGVSPTFDAEPVKRVEVHLLDYGGEDFYGQALTFAFHQRLRGEEKFEHVTALVTQIQADCEAARSWYASPLNDSHSLLRPEC